MFTLCRIGREGRLRLLGRFEVFKGVRGYWRWRFHCPLKKYGNDHYGPKKGRSNKSYRSKSCCIDAIESIQKHVAAAPCYVYDPTAFPMHQRVTRRDGDA